MSLEKRGNKHTVVLTERVYEYGHLKGILQGMLQRLSNTHLLPIRVRVRVTVTVRVGVRVRVRAVVMVRVMVMVLFMVRVMVRVRVSVRVRDRVTQTFPCQFGYSRFILFH